MLSHTRVSVASQRSDDEPADVGGDFSSEVIAAAMGTSAAGGAGEYEQPVAAERPVSAFSGQFVRSRLSVRPRSAAIAAW